MRVYVRVCDLKNVMMTHRTHILNETLKKEWLSTLITLH